MEQRELGRSGIAVTHVILGCGNFGGVGSSPAFFGQGIPRDDAFRIMDAAWELGITTFDTADAYGGGRSETWIGEWLATKDGSVRDAIMLQTKTFNPNARAPTTASARAASGARSTRSLSRLGVERVGALPRARVRPGRAAGGDAARVRRARARGQGRRRRRVELLGASSSRRRSSCLALEGLARYECVQNSFSLLDRADEETVLPRLPRARARLRGVRPARRRLAHRASTAAARRTRRARG